MSQTAPRLLDVSEIARMLDARADTLAKELLPDGRRNGHEWVARCPWRGDRTPGSFSVHLGGAKSGVWRDFAANEGGDMLDLVGRVLFGGDKKRAITWAKRWLGLDAGDPAAIEQVRRATPSPEAIGELEAKEAEERKKAAFRLWLAGTRNILDGPVDRYLRGRGIALAGLGHVPGAMRFHPALWHEPSKRKWPAMVTAIAGPDGRFVACHRTWLEIQADGTVRKAPVANNKMTLGGWRGGAIRLWRANNDAFKKIGAGDIVDITEGIEDGLSVAAAMPEARVIAAISVSGFGSVALPPAVTHVRLWAQNGDGPEAVAAFDAAVAAHHEAGRVVLIPAIPASIKDVNDLLRGTGA